MKTLKVILALLLVAALSLGLFTACAAQQEPEGSGGVANGGAGDSGNADDGGFDEITTIKMVFPDVRMTAADYGEPVAEAINAYTEETYGIHIDLQWMTYADLQKKLQLEISGGEQMDLIYAGLWNAVGILYPKGMLMDITDYMQTYAPDALELMQEYMGPFTYDGRIYGIPTNRGYVKNYYIIMRKDILDELGMTELANNMQTFSEYEEILQAVKENYTDEGTGLYGVGRGSGAAALSFQGYLSHGEKFSDYETFDYLSDPAGVVYVNEDNQVEFYGALEDFEAECIRVASWRENGWLWPDTVYDENHGDSLIKSGVQFSSIQGSEYGVEVTKRNSTGYELVCRNVCTGMIKTDVLTFSATGVPITAEEPEAACRIINAMYTDSTLMNLLVWGVEGTDYTVEDGQVVFPEYDHYYEADYFMGNNLILTPLAGNGTDYYEQLNKLNTEAEKSAYLGFSMNTEPLELLTANLTAVKGEFYNELVGGNYTPEMYGSYLEKMEAVGLNDYLAEVQNQLDAWLANQ